MPDSASKNNTARFSTLCSPDDEKSCFACCPPIRPAGYDHADHQQALTRQFWENTRDFARYGPGEKIITGFQCWGLGFLDQKRVMIGCMLHPGRNQGRDLRDLTGYGDKCRRELCQEAVIFSGLASASAEFVLELARGLNSFAYSSLKRNPAFRLLHWGPKLIESLALSEPAGLDRDEYLKRYAFLERDLDPKRDAYPVELLLDRFDLNVLGRSDFLTRYRDDLTRFSARHRQAVTLPLENRPYLHQLDLPSHFINFLRHALGWSRSLPSQAEAVRRELDRLLIEF
ncbi:MAG: hypothetical protein JRJ73_11275 [Deltaproteobacteria bacterium]|nr:hypothetical protein [Deltaproteobacteria bacterium]